MDVWDVDFRSAARHGLDVRVIFRGDGKRVVVRLNPASAALGDLVREIEDHVPPHADDAAHDDVEAMVVFSSVCMQISPAVKEWPRLERAARELLRWFPASVN